MTTTTIAVPTSCAGLCTKLTELAQRIDDDLTTASGGAAIDYAAVEQRVADALGEVERGLHAQVLARLDIDVPAIRMLGDEYRRIGRAESEYHTLAGTVRVMRTMYRKTERNGDTIDPVSVRAGVIVESQRQHLDRSRHAADGRSSPMNRAILSVVFVALGASPAAAFGTADEAEPHDPELVSPENLGRAGEAAEGAASTIELASQLVETHSALSELDHALDEHIRDDHGGPDVPSSCAPTSPTCAECFAAAYREVNFTRITLERLRTIHSRTLAFIRAAEALGDTTSGVHGVAGLSWQYAKMSVEEGKRSFEQTSRAKYEGLIQNMRRALDMVAACERDNFHNPDWYSRFGFIYYDFVRNAYAIHD